LGGVALAVVVSSKITVALLEKLPTIISSTIKADVTLPKTLTNIFENWVKMKFLDENTPATSNLILLFFLLGRFFFSSCG
jgi:hypothetical protein